jgi:hypothetical protein
LVEWQILRCGVTRQLTRVCSYSYSP